MTQSIIKLHVLGVRKRYGRAQIAKIRQLWNFNQLYETIDSDIIKRIFKSLLLIDI